jgi:hypothetical protein
MPDRVSRAEYPWWVKVSIWGVPGRAGLLAFVGLSVAMADASDLLGLWDWRFLCFGPPFLLTALMYWLAIRWIDRHGTWDADG